MKTEILSSLDNPAQLEKLYRTDKSTFKREFKDLYPEFKEHPLVAFWNERLNFSREEISLGSNKDFLFIVFASIVAALVAKLPVLLSISEEYFYPRNIGFIVFPALSAYFVWKNKLSAGKIAFIAGLMLLGIIFINSFPVANSNTLILSCIHLPIILWAIFGFAYTGGRSKDIDGRLGYLKYNGDLVVMTALILIAGAIMSGITIGLFELIGFSIERFYFENVVVIGLAVAPILGAYLTQTNPQLVDKVSPVIARIFSPLVLVMLVIYLIAIVYSGKDPYNDREFLLVFNGLLIGVMAIIFFSVAESSTKSPVEFWILLLLSVVTIIVNVIALSAILFRISEWGITANRAAVLGSNVLILINLLLVTAQLFRVVSKKANITGVGQTIARYLPVYCLWAIIVTFIFPLIFGFK